MKRLVTTATLSAVLAVAAIAGPALAAQPADPGCFGTDRAETIHTTFQGSGAPGASEWGAIAGERAGANGDLNRAYKATCGGDPTP